MGVRDMMRVGMEAFTPFSHSSVTSGPAACTSTHQTVAEMITVSLAQSACPFSQWPLVIVQPADDVGTVKPV